MHKMLNTQKTMDISNVALSNWQNTATLIKHKTHILALTQNKTVGGGADTDTMQQTFLWVKVTQGQRSYRGLGSRNHSGSWVPFITESAETRATPLFHVFEETVVEVVVY